VETITVDGRSIAYTDQGQGPPVILAHCSSGSHREWTQLIEFLRGRYRVLAPDLIGYGKSERWADGQTLEPSADPNVILRLAEIAGGRVHLAGHSYGAAITLEAARVLGNKVASLTLVEPVAFHLLRATGHPQWNEVNRLAGRITRAMGAGRRKRAAGAYMGYWIGRPKWWLMPRSARKSIVSTVGKVAAEFAMIAAMPWRLTDYARIGARTRLIVGERSPKGAKAVIELLEGILPRAHTRVVKGAGHMSPVTHREEVALMMARHIDESRIAASLALVLPAGPGTDWLGSVVDDCRLPIDDCSTQA